MCGIVGVLSFGSDIREQEVFVRCALKTMHHRGPDSSGTWTDNQAYITGFVRLAIRDTSCAADQPMVSPCGDYVISFNGEIYNTERFLPALKRQGVVLKTTSDTEVLLHSLIHLRLDAVLDEADGIFAFAFYDVRRKRLSLARDRAGIKPLYYSQTNDLALYSSQYDHLINHPRNGDRSVDVSSLRTYLELGYVPPGPGLIENTELVPPGSYIVLQPSGEVRRKTYFDFPATIQPGHTEDFGQVLSESVRSQLVSDVPLGTFMSGGVDSPLVSLFAKQHVPSIQSFTIGVDDPVHDERVPAETYARLIGTQHHVRTIAEQDLLGLIKDNSNAFSEPFADFSSLPTLLLSAFVREKITVALSGDGGDELFWGYPRNSFAFQHLRLITGSRLRTLAAIGSEILLGRTRTIPLRFARGLDFVGYSYQSLFIYGAARWAPLLMPQTQKREPRYCENLRQSVSRLKDEASWMGLMRKVEFDIHLQRILLKVDRASMFRSLEVRVPFLSNAMLDHAQSKGPRDCISGRQGKCNLKSTLRTLTGSDLPLQPKRGFTIPIGDWLRGPLRKDVEAKLLQMPTELNDLVSGKAVRQLLDAHMNREQEWGWMVWALYALVNWHQCHRRPFQDRK
jgi:asparagine synthase (glutamine-hydrolysing)